jgi:hypothetical protein
MHETSCRPCQIEPGVALPADGLRLAARQTSLSLSLSLSLSKQSGKPARARFGRRQTAAGQLRPAVSILTRGLKMNLFTCKLKNNVFL